MSSFAAQDADTDPELPSKSTIVRANFMDLMRSRNASDGLCDLGYAVALMPRMREEGGQPLNLLGPWLGGGCVRKAIFNEMQDTDLDVLFYSARQFEEWKVLMMARNEESIVSINDRQPHIVTFEVKAINGRTYVIQAIRDKFFSRPEDIVKDHDFTCCQFAYDGTDVYHTGWAMIHSEAKMLVVANPKTPVGTMRRLCKYGRKGFYCDTASLQDLLRHVHANPKLIDLEMKSSDAAERLVDPKVPDEIAF